MGDGVPKAPDDPSRRPTAFARLQRWGKGLTPGSVVAALAGVFAIATLTYTIGFNIGGALREQGDSRAARAERDLAAALVRAERAENDLAAALIREEEAENEREELRRELTERRPSSPYAFIIRCPLTGGSVPFRFTVSGAQSGSPAEGPVWLVVKGADQPTWYVNLPVDPRADGTWSQEVQLGDPPPGDEGSEWTIALVGVTRDGDAFLTNVVNNFEQYADTGISLPEDTVIGQSIKVTRNETASPNCT